MATDEKNSQKDKNNNNDTESNSSSKSTKTTHSQDEQSSELDVVDGLPPHHKEEEEIQEEEEEWKEERLIKEINCSVKRQADGNGLALKLLLKLEDEMNRQLCRTISEEQKGIDLASELVDFGLINELDRDKVAGTIQKCIQTPA